MARPNMDRVEVASPTVEDNADGTVSAPVYATVDEVTRAYLDGTLVDEVTGDPVPRPTHADGTPIGVSCEDEDGQKHPYTKDGRLGWRQEATEPSVDDMVGRRQGPLVDLSNRNFTLKDGVYVPRTADEPPVELLDEAFDDGDRYAGTSLQENWDGPSGLVADAEWNLNPPDAPTDPQ